VVTHPPGTEDKAEPLPAVMMVHGGPWVRGTTRGWNGYAQFLASRGYRVLEVDFRGSTGLGMRHFTAGINQWGLAMQDDLVDAIDWAAAQKLVDRSRVCIFGGSYGGYAALMGPIRHPDRYRCAASFAGVTDIMLMFDDSNSDLTEFGRTYTMPRLSGDPVKDAERLRQTSPVNRVSEIRVPLLLAQGGMDRRVTKEHANRFISAARAAKVDIETVEYPEEGHGLSEAGNHIDFLQRLEKLLARTLKQP
jgi:dipeptidyl aminopeptidase/acylaminoacyl peptidase